MKEIPHSVAGFIRFLNLKSLRARTSPRGRDRLPPPPPPPCTAAVILKDSPKNAEFEIFLPSIFLPPFPSSSPHRDRPHRNPASSTAPPAASRCSASVESKHPPFGAPCFITPTGSRPPTLDSMSQRPPQQRRPPSQRTTLARQSTPATLKTTSSQPALQARSGTQTAKRSALMTRSQRTAPKVLTNAGIKYEANRISTPRFDGMRR